MSIVKTLKSMVKPFVFALSQWLNCTIASFYGWAKGPVNCDDAMSSFGLVSGDSVLVLAPHPDDESAGMGGTISQLQDSGVKVVLALLTDGCGSKAGELATKTAQQRASIRHEEYQAATAILGNGFVKLGPFAQDHTDWPNPGQLLAHCHLLQEQLSQDNIKIIFSPPSIDFHPHHRAAVDLAHQLSEVLIHRPKIICYEVQAPFRALEPDFWVQLRTIDDERKKNAIDVYRSQSQSLSVVIRLNALRQSLARSSKPIEVFTSVERLMDESPLNHGLLRSPFYDLRLLFRRVSKLK